MNLYYYTNATTTNTIGSMQQYIQTKGNYALVEYAEYFIGITNNIVFIFKQQETGGGGNCLSRNLKITMEPRP